MDRDDWNARYRTEELAWTADANRFVVAEAAALPCVSAATGAAPGRMLDLVARDRSNLDGGWGGPRDPAVQATPEEMRAMLEDLGLTVTKAERVERPVDTSDGIRVAYDHVVVARR